MTKKQPYTICEHLLSQPRPSYLLFVNLNSPFFFPFSSVVCRDRKTPERRGEGRGEIHRRRHQQEHETGPESFNTSQAVS